VLKRFYGFLGAELCGNYVNESGLRSKVFGSKSRISELWELLMSLSGKSSKGSVVCSRSCLKTSPSFPERVEV
jgi:hypothetical protein